MSLTVKQEIFVQRLIEGDTQTDAYRFAYNCDNMKDATISNNAYKLMQNNEISTRYKELLEEHKQKALWTRGKAEKELMWLLEKSKEDIEYKGLKQANSSAMMNSIKELNVLSDVYANTKKDVDIEYIKAKIELLKGSKKDTSLLDALIEVINE